LLSDANSKIQSLTLRRKDQLNGGFMMQFKDAAYEILKQTKKPLHYNEITEQVLGAGLLDTAGKTPHATMGAMLYSDTLNTDSRFRRGDQKGTFALKSRAPQGIEQQIGAIRAQVRKELRAYLKQMPPQKFEDLIRALLDEMGFIETETTPFSGDKGVDVRGMLKVDQLSTIRVAIQAKRWVNNVGSDIVQKLRGALKITDAEHGIVITPSDFTGSAKEEAQSIGKIPINLVNGEQLVEMLIHYQVGARQTQYIVPEIDEEYWTEIIGISPSPPLARILETVAASQPCEGIVFPLKVQANHKGHTYSAELLDLQGNMLFNGKQYITPTSAAKAVPLEWKEVNGWSFWRYLDRDSEKWIKIGGLRPKQIN
jgi:restriction system protein